jgi:hypothetical protein
MHFAEALGSSCFEQCAVHSAIAFGGYEVRRTLPSALKLRRLKRLPSSLYMTSETRRRLNTNLRE